MVDPLASIRAIVYKYKTSAQDPLPGDRRRPAAAGRGGEFAAGGCCRARPSCRQRTTPAGSRSARRSSCCATRAWSTPARASAGSSPSTRCASRSAGSARSRAQLAASGVALRAPDPRLRLRGGAAARAAGARRRARCCGCGASTWPTASRSPASRCGARRSSAPTLSRADVERAPFYELLDVTARRRDADDRRRRWPTAADAELLEVPGRLAGAALRAGHLDLDRHGRCCSSEHVFPAHRTEFVVDLPSPTGLYLVEG